MVINYFGDGCFRLQSGETSLLVDPNSNRLKADVVLKTVTPVDVAGVAANEIVFPGEYELKEIQIRGWPIAKESTDTSLKTLYLVRWEEISFVFLGHLANGLEPDVLEELSGPDILFMPTCGELVEPSGGKHVLAADAAATLTKKLEPAVVMPSFSKHPNDFLKALGQKAEAQEKFVFKKKDLAGLKGKVILLKNT